MSEAVRIIRSSQGDEDKLALDVQREKTEALAADLDATIGETIDLSIHSGFSSFTRPDADELIDQHPDIQELIPQLHAGEYDYLIAHDDTRVARDEFFFVVQYACIEGGVEFKFVEDVDTDSLSFRVQRVVETHVKQKEIRRSMEAREKRLERGAYEGQPPIGTKWDDDRFQIEPDKHFPAVLDILRMRDQGLSYTDIIEETDLTSSRGTLANILDRRDTYEAMAEEYDYVIRGDP